MIAVDRYIQAWRARQQGNTYKRIGELMGVSGSWARTMVVAINRRIKRNGNKLKKIEALTKTKNIRS